MHRHLGNVDARCAECLVELRRVFHVVDSQDNRDREVFGLSVSKNVVCLFADPGGIGLSCGEREPESARADLQEDEDVEID